MYIHDSSSVPMLEQYWTGRLATLKETGDEQLDAYAGQQIEITGIECVTVEPGFEYPKLVLLNFRCEDGHELTCNIFEVELIDYRS